MTKVTGSDPYQKSRQLWEETTLQKTLSRRPERQEKFVTVSSTPIERLYTPSGVGSDHYLQQINLPGQYPYTRGIHATGYRGKLWTMRMFAGYGTAEETNRRFKYLLAEGQTGLSIAFDLPTLYGYDTDAPEALGEFGKCGVAISSLRDMEILLDGLPLDQITTSMTINSPAAVIWAMYIAVADKAGIPRHKLGGTAVVAKPISSTMQVKTQTRPGYANKERPEWKITEKSKTTTRGGGLK